MSQSNKTDHYIAPYDDSVSFDELPDSAPSSRYSPSWTGWLGISVVSVSYTHLTLPTNREV